MPWLNLIEKVEGTDSLHLEKASQLQLVAHIRWYKSTYISFIN